MRIVVLSTKRPGGHVNDLIHRGFFDAFPGQVLWIGPGEQIAPEVDLAAQVERLAPDYVIVNMKKRVPWLRPEWIARIKRPRAIIEVDFCYEENEYWYEAAQFDGVFFRARVDYERSKLKGREWLPFSVHPSWVVPSIESREFAVGFAGTIMPRSNYPVRNLAIETLTAAGLLKRPVGGQYGESYMKWWQTVPVGLTCTATPRVDNAKHLIIPAAGCVLLTDGTPGTQMLFPREVYEIYKPDCSNLVDIVTRLRDDPAGLKERRGVAVQIVRDCHLHQHRWKDFIDTMGGRIHG